MAENPYGIPEPPRPQPAVPENPYGLPEPRGGQGLRHWPGCNGNHQPDTGCNGGYGERVKAQMAAELAAAARETQARIARRPTDPTPRIIAIAQEDITAGAEVEIDMSTGMMRMRRQ